MTRNALLKKIYLGISVSLFSFLVLEILATDIDWFKVSISYNLVRDIVLLFNVVVWLVLVVPAVIKMYDDLLMRRYHKSNSDSSNDKSPNNKELMYLDQLITYNQKRREIEEEISRLEKLLTNTDLPEYIDVNRLILQSQINAGNSPSNARVQTFLKQYGLNESDLEMYKDKVMFLTPFNKSGYKLFQTCRTILADMNYMLIKSDDIVDRNDINANIVQLIVRSKFIIANLSERNVNVYYELGLCRVLGKQVILLLPTKSGNEDEIITEIGFDVRQNFIIVFNENNYSDLERKLTMSISKLK